MKKRNITVGLLMASIFLSGCATANPTPEQESTKQTSSETSADEYFEKNQKCLRFKNEVATKLESKDSPFGEASLEQIFYSPKVDNCVYVEYTQRINENDPTEYYYNRRLFDINDDGPSAHPLEACLVAKLPADCADFDKKIEVYKE